MGYSLKQKSEAKKKRFKLFKSDTGRVIYDWAYQCPKCKKIRKYNFENWIIHQALEFGMGLSFSCGCKYGQTITLKDLREAILISQKEYQNLSFEK